MSGSAINEWAFCLRPNPKSCVRAPATGPYCKATLAGFTTTDLTLAFNSFFGYR